MNERGGAVYGLLATIGAVVVIMVIAFAVCTGTAGAVRPGTRPAVTQHRDDCRHRNCDDSDDDGYRNVSPGPFDRSPVDIHDNQICISPDCSTRDSGTTTTTRGAGR